jgi:hypothetical protein
MMNGSGSIHLAKENDPLKPGQGRRVRAAPIQVPPSTMADAEGFLRIECRRLYLFVTDPQRPSPIADDWTNGNYCGDHFLSHCSLSGRYRHPSQSRKQTVRLFVKLIGDRIGHFASRDFVIE